MLCIMPRGAVACVWCGSRLVTSAPCAIVSVPLGLAAAFTAGATVAAGAAGADVAAAAGADVAAGASGAGPAEGADVQAAIRPPAAVPTAIPNTRRKYLRPNVLSP